MPHLFYDFFFFLNAVCQYIQPNLRSVIFGLSPFGCLPSITQTPVCSIISCGNVIFELTAFLFTPSFSTAQLGRRRRLGIVSAYTEITKEIRPGTVSRKRNYWWPRIEVT